MLCYQKSYSAQHSLSVYDSTCINECPLQQGGFTYSLIAPTTPVLKLQNAFRANFTPTIQADLVYGTENRTEYQLSLQVRSWPTATSTARAAPMIRN
jgi:hypothetical protein